MDRHRYRDGVEFIAHYLPQQFRWIDFVTDYDPGFIGLHFYEKGNDGRSYRDNCHCVYPFHQKRLSKDLRKTTIVLYEPYDEYHLIHEVGHALHGEIGLELFSFKPVSEYASTNWLENFAESFAHYYFMPEWFRNFDEMAFSWFEGFLRNRGRV